MQKNVLAIALLLLVAFHASAQLKVSADKHYLLTKDGKPFFWLGDTAWELFHRLSREEADQYLTDRAKKGFTVIQAVILAELEGLNVPNVYGNKPLLNNDPTKPNEAYFKHVDYVVNKAEKLGLIMALLPSWGDKWNKKWGAGPEIFTPQNAAVFGEYVGRRYKNKPVIWVMGGDRDIENEEDFAIIRAMQAGIEKADATNLFTFHPQGGKSSADFFKDDNWVDFHMAQTGHSTDSKTYEVSQRHWNLTPTRPYINGEPNYEDHPNKFNPSKFGWMDDFDTREAAYWSMLSGASGHTYGNHNIWQFYAENRKPVSWARTHWKTALHHAGATHVGIMRRFFEKRPWQRLVGDQSIIISDNTENNEYVVAAVSKDSDFMMAYLPYGNKVNISTAKIKGAKITAWLFNPRDGQTLSLGTLDNKGTFEYTPHSVGRGSDWVLVIDDASKNYPNPKVP